MKLFNENNAVHSLLQKTEMVIVKNTVCRHRNLHINIVQQWNRLKRDFLYSVSRIVYR